MTVTSTDNRKEYAGNGATTSFSTNPVVFFASGDLTLYVVNDDGTVTTLIENTHYTVSGGGTPPATGSVDLSAGSSPYGAPASDGTLVIVRDLDIVQETDFVQNDGSDADVAEAALDRQTVIAQQLAARIDRSFRLADSDVSGADLQLPSAADRASRVLGFDGDGGLTTYDASSSVTTSDNVTFVQSGTAAIAGTVQRKLREHVSVFDFMTAAQIADVQAGTALLDVTTAVQNAIASAYRVYFPTGTYLISSGLTMTLQAIWYGDGKLKTIIKQSTNFNAITVNNIQHWMIEGLQVWNSQASASVTSGDAIKLTGAASYGTLRDIYINNCYNGVHVANAPILRSYNVDIQYFKNAGWLFDGGTNFDAYITDGIVDGALSASAPTTQNGTYSIRMVDMCEAIVFRGGEFNGSVYNLSTAASAYGLGTRPAYCRFTNCFFDNSTTGLDLDKCVDMTFTGCWISNRGSGAIVGTNNSDGVVFESTTFANNSNYGCLVQGGAVRTSFNNCKVVGNSASSASTFHGLIFGDTCTDFSITNCTITNSGWGLGTQGYGILINGTSHDRYVITGNNLTGNASGGLSDGTTGSPERYIKDNIGYRTENSGVTGAIATGATVTHGLAATPTVVIITPQDGTPTAFFPSSIGATTFAITFSGGGSHSFSWSARCSV